MAYIGIDPGVAGGIAVIHHDGSFIDMTKMPATEADVLSWLRAHSQPGDRAMLELVRASPQMGVVSSFTFGRGYGGLRMALIACGMPFDEVTPVKWQTTMQCRSRGDKNVTKRRAQELFPKIVITHAVADALLIAEYCRRKHEGVSK